MIGLLAALPFLIAASAQDLDIELVRPTFAEQGLPSVDHPRVEEGLSLGAYLAYTRDPLVRFLEGVDVGAVVGDRQTLVLGLTRGLGRRVGLRVVVPAVVQWGSDVPELGAEGFFVGDPSAGVRVLLLDRKRGALAATTDLYLPFGATGAWAGEGQGRARLGVTGAWGGPFLEVLGDLGVMARSVQDTSQDLEVGSELVADLGLRHGVWPDRVALWAALSGRRSLDPRYTGAGNRVAELTLGTQVRTDDDLQVDLGVGRGLGPGYGTSTLRAWVGLTKFLPAPRTAAAPPPAVVWVGPDPAGTLPEPEVEEVPWAPEELARVRASVIEIRDPIQFRYDTDQILPVSQPTLEAVARILLEAPWILHVVVEGHASEEGDFDYNYDLSLRRARAVFQALVEAGVHPRRVSCRAMGEVAPVVAGTDETALARNRRVVFRIAEQVDPLDPLPDLGPATAPWAAGEEVPP